MRTINKIIVHCSATPEGRAVTVEEIDRWHKERGFTCIGYHYIVYLDGSVHLGREVEKSGAHCTGQNKNSIGICYIGGLERDCRTPKDTRTDAQKSSLLALLKELKAYYPHASIHGHREFAAKACPCFDVQSEYGNI